MKTATELAALAREASRKVSGLNTVLKNQILMEAADALEEKCNRILAGNVLDMDRAVKNAMPLSLQDRLMLNKERIHAMAQGLRKVAALEDPTGKVLEMNQRPNGLMIGRKRVPLGVVAVIYEARPNVTSDVFGLCFKTGNAAVLRCGSDAYKSCSAVVSIIQEVLDRYGIRDALQICQSRDREETIELMRCNEYVDVLIPRGGAGLIRSVVENATVPVIETGTGNCHVYVDEGADVQMAVDIIVNAKTQRVGVCNACESILIHRSMIESVMPALAKALAGHHVEMHADADLIGYIDPAFAKEACEEDWGREYLDYIVSMKTVDSVDEAIAHINRYNTGHSEAIVTRDYDRARKFLDEVDAAAVYVNASTRFTDGEEFGFGAEIGISTQKLHARGPMGLEALTTTKFIILGQGQVR